MDTIKLITVFGNTSFFGFCNSNPSDQIKVISCDDYRLSIGSKITILFNNSNLAENPKLNVNNTGEKPILFENQPISTTALVANYSYEFVYDGTSYHLLKAQSVNSSSISDPIGTIISYMGNTPPKEYLACDGTVYNIEDYQALADHIKDQFGSYDFFGGNGTTTFAVPDLRGEFLRGTGTNSHTNQGDGANVGTHQDGTEFQVNAYNASDKTILYKGYNNTWDSTPKYFDSYVSGNNSVAKFIVSSGTTTTESSASKGTSRPTNTSVLYCIKYTNAVAAKQITDWAANTEYNAGDCAVYKDKIYKCISPNSDSTFNLLKWVCLTANGEEELGHITFGYNIQSGYIPLNGSTYNRIDYPDLINWVTENSLWAESATDYGKFGAGNGTTTFTTPNFIGKFIECDDGTNTGDYTAAGLPNITGKNNMSYGDSSSVGAWSGARSGAFNTGTVPDKYSQSVASDTSLTNRTVDLEFDASKSNPIYSDSVNTVQPESIKLIPQIKYRKPNKSLPVNAVRRTLWEGEVGNLSNNSQVRTYIDIDDSFKNYDMLGFHITVTGNDFILRRPLYREISTEDLSNLILSQSNSISLSMCWGYSDASDYCDIQPTSTNTRIQLAMGLSKVTKVIGIKYINENQYSTEEQLIGTWIDGKPLYQKTYSITSPIDDYQTVADISNLNIASVVEVSGIIEHSTGKYLTIPTYHNDTEAVTAYITGNLTAINMHTSTNLRSKNATITIKYTKSTS